MKKKTNLRRALALMLSFSMLVAMVSCEKDGEDQEPELPPVESMLMDFSDFSTGPAGSKGTEESYANFLYSYLTVGFWNVYATLASALPVAAYAIALDQDPVLVDEGIWQWSYDYENYEVTLEAERISNEKFSATMMVALASAPNTRVTWFDGEVRYDGTAATWTIYKDGSIPVLEIQWNKDFEKETEELSYTCVEAGINETGSYIKWARDIALELDASYAISMAAGMTSIEWNSTTIEGRVKSLLHFEDDAWHCWESQENGLMDKDCS